MFDDKHQNGSYQHASHHAFRPFQPVEEREHLERVVSETVDEQQQQHVVDVRHITHVKKRGLEVFFAVALQLCVSGNFTADSIAFVTVGVPAARYIKILPPLRRIMT